MSFVNDLLLRLFPKNESSVETPAIKTILSEPIERSDSFKQSYNEWLLKEKPKFHISRIAALYQNHMQGQVQAQKFYVYKERSSNGFYISNDTFLDTEEYHFVFEWFYHRLQSMGYAPNMNKYKVCEVNDEIKHQYYYYLKPPLPKNLSEKINQMWGNAHLELVFQNDSPLYIKLMLHAYSDNLYAEAWPFEDFITSVFKV